MHRYGPSYTYPCVFFIFFKDEANNLPVPLSLADFYEASQFEMINFTILNIEHYNSDPMISLFGNMQITFHMYVENDATCINDKLNAWNYVTWLNESQLEITKGWTIAIYKNMGF